MLADPQSVTYNTVAKSLVASFRGPEESQYRLNDSGVQYLLRVNHRFGPRFRTFAQLRRESYVSDPVIPANNVLAGMSATITLDWAPVGLTAADVQYLGNALTGWASSAQLLKLINGET